MSIGGVRTVMKAGAHRSVAQKVWIAFFWLLAATVVMVVLVEVSLLSGVALAVFIPCALAAFVGWSVLALEPSRLVDRASYKKGRSPDRR